ncbi:hypothetical protein BCR44DRAFT_48641 [Catenaria anguillulae PL171]|uniref:DUF6604 domain-containing protein n=1 Tax=Catenaria anguillulae PL171 TaxID=765915 RepID=A0A1Y2HPX5_9FUNG|nr:hypothetical protein BCR44DRAFT_48641 [Catenaria anguillulae PL171]
MNPRKESSSNAPPAASTPRARLPSDLFNCYKQYKANTDRLASWLGATAHLLGYSFPHAQLSTPGVHASVNPRPSGRLKGKARKAAATGGSSNGDARQRSGLHNPLTNLINGNFSIEVGDDDDDSMTTAAAALPPTLLNTNQFVDLARFITAKVDPPVTVPSRILGWARSAIKSRRLCADWFGADQSGDSAVKRSNQSHQFFITILEQVVDILATRVARTSQQSQQAVGIAIAFNRFAALNVGDNEDADGDVDADADDDDWDTVDSLVDATVSGQPGQCTEEPKGKRQRYCAKLRDEDIELALLDHLLMLDRTRLFIRETWQNRGQDATRS